MNHRHLLPNEIDLLVDGEVGFGVAPLRAHIEACAECRAELESARLLVQELESLPHLAPGPLFAQRVMSQVQVFEPWHVTALETLRGWLPRSRPMQVLAAAGGLSVGFVMTVAAVFVAARLDMLGLLGEQLVERVSGAAGAAAADLLAWAFGEAALAALSTAGPLGLVGGLGVFFLTVAGAATGLKALSRISSGRQA
jgi:anti-sigma factor RsiW